MGLFNKKTNNSVQKNETEYVENEKKLSASTDIPEEFNEIHITHFLPKSYDETKEIADCLIRFKNVTVKLTEIDKAEKKRLVDFLTGVMYALDGDYKKIDIGIYYFWINN